MTAIHLGVIDMRYTSEDDAITTGDVASILEKNYALFTGFAISHMDSMADKLANSYAKALETMVMGGPAGNPEAFAMSQISSDMQKYIWSQQAERVLAPGSKGHPVPTRAALEGITHRFKDPELGTSKSKRKLGRKGARRPSFRDTGMLENSLRAWMD